MAWVEKQQWMGDAPARLTVHALAPRSSSIDIVTTLFICVAHVSAVNPRPSRTPTSTPRSSSSLATCLQWGSNVRSEGYAQSGGRWFELCGAYLDVPELTGGVQRRHGRVIIRWDAGRRPGIKEPPSDLKMATLCGNA